MALLSSKDIATITTDIRNIIGDSSISTSIVYRQTGTTVSSWDPTTGIIPDMYTESTVSAFKSGYTIDEVGISGGLIELDDVKFIIMRESVSDTLTIDDMIRESAVSAGGSIYQSSTTYQVKSISRDPLDICYFIRVRKLGD